MSASVEVLGSPEWLAALKDSGPERELRIEELRRFLLVALRAGLAGNAAAGDAFIEDVAQDATLRILERIDSFQGRSRFTTWATTIAIRLAFTELRRARWRDVSLDQFLASGLDGATLLQSDSPETAARSDNPGHQAHRRGVMEVLQRVMLTDLTDRQRIALEAELEGMNQVPLAEKLGTNPNALYKLVHDARKRLRAAQLVGTPAILPVGEMALRRQLEHWFESHSVRPRIVAEVEDTALLIDLGAQGLGFIPVYSAGESPLGRSPDCTISVVGLTAEADNRPAHRNLVRATD